MSDRFPGSGTKTTLEYEVLKFFIRANELTKEAILPKYFTICFDLFYIFYHLKVEICYVSIVGLSYSLQFKTFQIQINLNETY